MLSLYQNLKKERPRLTNNIILSVVTLLGCAVAVVIASPTQAPLEALTVGTGYVGLGLLALTLLIGPINMLKVRKNPVNMNFRRDAGIWAGIASLAHVVLAFGLEINWGGTLLGYFLYKDGSPKLNLFGISNYIGLAATLVLTFLLVLSNNHFLKRFKGKKWKNLQRFNYLLFALVLGHTFTQQVNNVRGLWMIAGALLVTLAVMAGQSIGFKIYRKREAERKVAPGAKTVPAKAGVATAAPSRSIPVMTGFSKLKVASAVAIVAMLGIGAGLQGLSLLNQPVTAQTGSVSTDETTASETSAAATATTPAVSESTSAAATATATTAATTTAATATAATTTAATTTAASTSATTTAVATTVAATTAATTTAATTTAATTAATTTAATTTAATTTAAATTTTVSSSSKSSGSTHTGGS